MTPPSDATSPAPKRVSKHLTIAALILGAALVAMTYAEVPLVGAEMHVTIACLITIALVWAIKPARQFARRIAGGINSLSPRWLTVIAWGIAILVMLYLPFAAWWQGRVLQLEIQDELSYGVMARIFASGRLWMPAHPLQDALETFYVFITPVYGSMYFPGAGFFYAIAAYFNQPLWMMAVIIAGWTCAMLFRVLARATEPSWALVSVLLLVSLPHFRSFATHAMSHMPVLACVLSCYWFFIKWRDKPTQTRTIFASLFAGLALITRPFDALMLLLPVALSAFTIARRGPGLWRWVLIATVCLAPFASLQMLINYGFTANVLKTPFAAYFDQYMPNAGFGFHAPDVASRPQTQLAQKIDFYDYFASGFMKSHTLQQVATLHFWQLRLTTMMFALCAIRLALGLIPLGIIRSWQSPDWSLAAGFVLLFAGYVFYPFYLTWYSLPGVAGFLMIGWFALTALEDRFGKSIGRVREAVMCGMIVTATFTQPFWWSRSIDQVVMQSPELQQINTMIRQHVQAPAIVFFKYRQIANYTSQHEPVYNLQKANIDESDVIRVHSLSDVQDRTVLRYYHSLGQDRNVYYVDRARATITPLGKVSELIDAHHLSPRD